MRWLVVFALLLGACAPGATDVDGASNGRIATATPATSPSPEPSPTGPVTPEPSEPSEPAEPAEPRSRAEWFAARLTDVNSDFYDSLQVWLQETGGKPWGNKFRHLELLGLDKQKMMRKLVPARKLERKVSRLVPASLRAEIHRNMKAARDLYKLTQPIEGKVRMKTSKPKGPRKLLGYYAKAERRFGVPWTILASVNLIESKMGRLNGPSSAGALGPMQFMPATWDAYGKGSPFNTHNAIMAAARYLSASGAPDRMRSALWNYNHSDYYVNAVLAYHRQMKAQPKSYYSYYFWQVFVRTTRGDKQLTGPGSNYRY